jgi:parallel beta-helix repeat protein
MSHATLQVLSGDIVYVKCGYYYEPNGLIITTNNVQFIGYKQVEGDLDLGQGMPINYDDRDNHWLEVPVIWGTNRYSVEKGIHVSGTSTLRRQNVVIKNFYISSFQFGVVLEFVDNSVVQNVFCKDMGDIWKDYDGGGIWLGVSHNNTIQNCWVLDVCAEGISIRHGNGNTVSGCKVFCDDNSTGTKSALDYYVLIVNGSSNLVLNNYIERKIDPLMGPPAHRGHGYTIQASAGNGQTAMTNLVMGCNAKSIDEPFVLRGSGAHHNDFIQSELLAGNLPDTEGCITFYAGPHDNNFRRIRICDAKVAIGYFRDDRVFDPASGLFEDTFDGAATDVAARNVLENCILECKEAAIQLSWWEDKDPDGGGTDKDVVDNLFVNCTFVVPTPGTTGAFFRANRESRGNQLINCIIKDFRTYAVSHGPSNPTASYYPPTNPPSANPYGFGFFSCCVWNPVATDFPLPQYLGTDNIVPPANPNLTGGSQYNLMNNSPCKNRGIHVQFGADFDGTPRPQQGSFDIGAQEFVPH